MHAHLNAVFGLFADRKQFNAVAEFFTVGNVLLRHARNSLARNFRERHFGMERKRRENGELICRVVALHVGSGIGFRISQTLRFFERGFVRFAPVRHFREDIVGRAVDDPHHRSDMVCLHAVEQRADHGNAAHAARLEIKPCIVRFRRVFKLVRVFADKFLIGRDDGFPRVQRGEHEFSCDPHAADHFHNDVHVGIGDDFRNIRGDFLFGNAERYRALAVDFEHVFDRNVHSLRFLVKLSVFGKNFVRSAADHAQP